MVLPVPGIEFLDDAVIPEPARQYFIFLRYCVAAEGVFAILRLLMGDIAGALSDVICVLFGVFFLRSDDWFRPIYLRLENTTLSMCCGGGRRLWTDFRQLWGTVLVECYQYVAGQSAGGPAI